jgi:hypothetical protein
MFHHISLILIAAGPGIKAEVVDSGTDKDSYKVGDKAIVRIAVKNTGDTDITTIEAFVAVEKQFLGNYVKLLSDHIQVPIYMIKPGQTEAYEQTYTIPNFPGKYRIVVHVMADGQEIGHIRKNIEVTR